MSVFFFYDIPTTVESLKSNKQFQESMIMLGFVIVGLLVISGSSAVYPRSLPGITPDHDVPVHNVKVAQNKSDSDVQNGRM